jgi:hypothetical protein
MSLQRSARFVSIFITLILCSVVPLHADEPPWYAPFEVKSQNGRFCAKVTTEAPDKFNAEWKLAVFEVVQTAAGVDHVEKWSCPYRYSGYPGALVANDGKTVVYIELWYHEDGSVIDFYREGKLIKQVKGKDIEFDRTKLEKTASHELWIEHEGRAQLDARGQLLVRTIDGTLNRYDTKTGRRMTDS